LKKEFIILNQIFIVSIVNFRISVKMSKLTFPIEVGPPRKVVKNMKEFLNYVNLYNGKKKAIFQSIYNFGKIGEENKPEYESAVIDKLFFDFDVKDGNPYENCNLLHQECFKENLKHSINFSGRGYHLYIYTPIYILKYKKEVVKGGQEYFINKLKLKIDKQIIGNIAQMARVPNTFHPKAGRFCIPLTQEQFEKGDEFIKQLSQQQNFVKYTKIGSKLFDIKQWDVKRKDEFDKSIIDLKPVDSSNQALWERDLPLCISKCLNNKNMGWKERYLVILYFKEKGYSINDVYKILKNHLSEVKLHHCITQEKQLQYLFNRNDLLFPSCKKLKEEGFCVEKCKFYENGIYK